ncbi:hypothetical protein SAMN05720759_10356 [Fibrobacter sp. UWB12]|nr:hypothetical protein SAMN05720759_10356 [Fibrobacter sp. UWB12]
MCWRCYAPLDVFDYLQLCCLVVMIRVWGGRLLVIENGDSHLKVAMRTMERSSKCCPPAQGGNDMSLHVYYLLTNDH